MGTFGATQTIAAGESAIAHTDLTATASSATVLLTPLTYSGSAARVVLFHPDVDRFTVRARGVFTAKATDPIVCLYLLYYLNGNVARIEPGSTSIPSDGTILTTRVFTGTTTGSNVLTLNCTVASADKDSTYKYSPIDPFGLTNSRVGYIDSSVDPGQNVTSFAYRDNAFGVLVLTSTAGAITGSSLEAQVIAYGK